MWLNRSTGRWPDSWRGSIPALTLALLICPAVVQSQIACDNDGILVEFDEKNDVVELKKAKVQEIAGKGKKGKKGKDREVDLAHPGVQSGSAVGNRLIVNGLSISAFPDEGIPFAEVLRNERKVWKAEFPKGMYEFNDKDDLRLEFEVTTIDSEASHVVYGPSSSVSLSIHDAGIDAKFHGGNPKSLKQLEGELDFRYFDLLQLSAAGTHRAVISLCVNVRGTI